jgi:uncharacterized protein (TIRG00374 family)
LHLPFFRGVKIYCAANIWGMFLPATIGADAIRAWSTSRRGLNLNEVIASIVVERMIGFLTALLFSLLSLFLLSFLGVLHPRFEHVWWFTTAMLVGFTAAFLASFSQPVFDLVHGRLLRRLSHTRLVENLRVVHSAYLAYRGNASLLASFFVLTLVERVIEIVSTWVIARGLGVEVDLIFIFGALPLALLISRIPISINGWGVFDGVFLLLMSLAGISAAESIAIALVARIIQPLAYLPWWVAQVIDSGDIRPPRALANKW